MILNDYIMCPDASPQLLGIFDFTIAPALLFYAYIPISALSLLLGILVFRQRVGFQLKNILLFVLTILFSLHILNEIVQWIAAPAGLIYFAWSLSLLFRTLILATTLYFAYVFVTGKDLSFNLKVIFSLIILPIIVLLPTELNVVGFDIDWCEALDGPLWLYLYGLQILSTSILFLYSLYYAFRAQRTREQGYLQSFYLLLGTSAFLAIFFGSEFLGDITTVFEINLVAPIGMLIFLSALSFIIVKFKAFNIKLAGAQALVVALIALIGSQLFFVETITNVMLVSLTLTMVTIAGFFLIRSVKHEIRQREEIEQLAEKLRQTNKRLRELDRQKSEFVSIASHQLRSPLTAIRGYASMLVEGSFGAIPKKAQEALERIHESSRFMALSIEDFLNVSRIEQGRMKYELSDFNLREVAEKVVDEMRPAGIKKGLVLMFRSECEGGCVVNADIGKVRQVLYNLIDNAMKYTPKGSITVIAHDDLKRKKMYITIHDTGVGMSKETLGAIFEKFVRAKNANSVNVSGTGLGLFVAKQMIEAMGGSVTPASDGEGKGSKFTIELPLV